MFTGIITDLGRVRSLADQGDRRFVFETGHDTAEIEIGASTACSGACLTVVEKGPGWVAMDASSETLAKTVLGSWAPGTTVNLERALRLGDELGGHLVSGHVDGIAAVVGREAEGDSLRFSFEAPQDLGHFIAPKGSVTLDGVSLTVNEVEGRQFGVNIIAHTAAVTTFGQRRVGDHVNLEIDLLARYLERLMTKDR